MDQGLFATDGGVSFGYAVTQPDGPLPPDIERYPLRYTGDRHILTYAPSGAGKSRRLLLSNILQLPNWSLLILDIKGELAAQTRTYRERTAGNQVVLMNPFRVLGLPSHGFNPVAALKIGPDFIDDAMALAEAIIRIEGQDSHWSASAQDLLCALIMYARLTQKGGGSLGYVRELLGLPALEFAPEVAAMIETGIRHKVEELGTKAARFLDISPENRELQSILSTARTQTRFLDSRPMKDDLARGAFDFAVMKDRPTTVYVNLPGNRLGSHSTYLRIIVTAFLQAMLKDSRAGQVPVLVMLDEAAQLGELPILRDSIALLRGYGVKVWSLYQDVPQHRGISGDRFESAVANSGVLQAFAPQDLTTARMLSERSGQTTASVLGYSAAAEVFAGRSPQTGGDISVSYASVPGVLPQELMAMPEGVAVLYSHRTRGRPFTFVPDPSEVENLDRILRGFP